MHNRPLHALTLAALALALLGVFTAPAIPTAYAAQDKTSDKKQKAPPKNWDPPVIGADDIAKLRKQAAKDGKVLVIDCWATWCGSCKAMFPLLHKAMADRGDKVLLASLSFDEGKPSIASAKKFLIKQHAWDNAYIAKPGDAKDAIAKTLSDGSWDGGALPAVFVYGKDGKPAFTLSETRGKPKDWVAEIAKAVDKAAKK